MSAVRSRAVGGLVLLVAIAALSVVPQAVQASALNAPLGVVVSASPVADTPAVNDGAVVSIVEIGNTVVVGGAFTTVQDIVAQQILTRVGIFAYDKTTMRVSTTFVPQLDNVVSSMVAGPDGHSVIVAGAFTHVNGVKRSRLAKLELADGAVDSTFAGSVQGGLTQAGSPLSLVVRGSDLYVGGSFTSLSGVSRLGLGAMNATTGAVLPWLNLPITHPRSGTASVMKLDVSADERSLVAVGNFTEIGGLARNQVAVVNLAARPAAVSSWSTQSFVAACDPGYDTYLRDVDISPDGSYFVAVTTGGYQAPPLLCDSVSKWALTTSGPNQVPLWVQYSGGDSLTAVAVTNAAVYVGGHERWGNNPFGNNVAAAGAVSRPGIGALDPLTGLPLRWDPTRDRGAGVWALVATPTTLYVGDDTNNIGGASHPRLAMFTVAGGTTNPTPVSTPLPVLVQRPQSDGSLDGTAFDGINAADAGLTQAAGGAMDWSQVRGAFYQNGFVYYIYADSSFYKASFDGTNFGTPISLTAAAGYIVPLQHFDNTITTLAYDNGRIYYTRSGQNRIFWRWFSLESDIVGSQEMTSYSATSPLGISGLDTAGATLYATTTNKLYAVPHRADGSVDWAARALVDDGTTSGHWAGQGDMFMSPGIGQRPDVPTMIHATIVKGHATVSWTAPADNGSTILTYSVSASANGTTVNVPGSVTHAVFAYLVPAKYTFKVRATNVGGTSDWSAASNAVNVVARTPNGYWMLGADGKVYAFGRALKLGFAHGLAVAIAANLDGTGYWTVDAAGNVSHFGAATTHGNRPTLHAGEAVSTISATPSGNGYWLFTNRGRAFPYGDAQFYGDMSHTRLNGPIVASVATPTGHGYYMVGSDGGVFSFGDAAFHGSTGNKHLNRPVVGIAPTPDNRGYWLVASDGGVFAFRAPFRGSMGATHLNQPVDGIVAYGTGYLMVASDGGVFDFSTTPFAGSLANHPPTAPIIGIAAA